MNRVENCLLLLQKRFKDERHKAVCLPLGKCFRLYRYCNKLPKKKVNYYIKYYRRSSLAFSVCCHFSESKSSSPLHMDPVFVSAIRDFRVKKIVPRCTKLIEGFFRDNIDFAKIQHTIMIVGVPNVGMYKQTRLYKKYLIRIVRISEETSLKKMSIMSWLIIR